MMIFGIVHRLTQVARNSASNIFISSQRQRLSALSYVYKQQTHLIPNTLSVTSRTNQIRNFRHAHSFAVVHVGGKQYKVTENDVIVTNKLDCEVGTRIRLEKSLSACLLTLYHSSGITDGKRDEGIVTALVAEQSKASKVIAFKKKRRKEHQQDVTYLRIQKVMMGQSTTTETSNIPMQS
eukprot:gene8587-10287_t